MFFSIHTVAHPYSIGPTSREIDTIAIDAEILQNENAVEEFRRQRQASIRDLRSRRNALIPVLKLPAEITIRIFRFCREWKDYRRERTVKWTVVTQVCQHWRNVAEEDMCIWACPVFACPRWAIEMLKRSKTACLSVNINSKFLPGRNNSQYFVDLALQHLQRTNELRLAVEDDTFQACSGLLMQHAPQLRLLSVHRRGRELDQGITHILPSNFLGGQVPGLRDLELSACPVPWNSPLFTSLTRLSLQRIAPHERPSLEDLADILVKLRDLQFLELKHCLPEGDVMLYEDIPTLEFPELRFLSISSMGLESVAMMRRFSFPSSTDLHLVCGSPASDDVEIASDFAPMIPLIGQRMRQFPKDSPGQTPHLEVICITGPFAHFLGLTTVPRDYSILEPMYPPCPDVELVFQATDDIGEHRSSFGAEEAIVASLSQGLLLQNLKILDVDIYLRLTSQMWIDCFGLLPRLHTIRLNTFSVGSLIHAIGEPTQASDEVAPWPPMFFLELRSLALVKGDFRLHFWSKSELQKALKLRGLYGFPIQSLALCDCDGIFKEDGAALQKLVPDFHWEYEYR